tara:strand:+ start:192 stop:464 length:273 start_codon:yes stop_codon:yes gene_type:complete
VKNLFLNKEGMATINPKNIDIMIEITEIYIVKLIPLKRNFKFVKPLILSGESMYQAHVCSELHDVSIKGNNNISFFTNGIKPLIILIEIL